MKVDPLDTDATMARRQRSRCDAQETWLPQAAVSRTSSWPLSQPPPADYPRGAASRFPPAPPRKARRRLVKACPKRFCGNVGGYTLSAANEDVLPTRSCPSRARVLRALISWARSPRAIVDQSRQ